MQLQQATLTFKIRGENI